MLEDIRACAALGAHGVASGCLTVEGDVNVARTTVLVEEARKAGQELQGDVGLQ